VRVLATPPPALHVLAAAPRTGKGTAAVEIIERLSRTKAEMRALIVCPAALVHQFAALVAMRSPDLRVETVDRQRYRELEAAAPIDGSPFAHSIVAVVSIDVVKHTDVARGVLATQWDLLVVDEAHHLTGQRGQVVRQLLDLHRADRAVLMSATPIDRSGLPDALLSTLSSEPAKQQGDAAELSIKMVHVNYTEPERAALRATDALAEELERGGFLAMGNAIRERAHSSIYALERSLREIRNRAAHGLSMDALEFTEVSPTQTTAKPGLILEHAEGLLRLLDEVEVDSKADALFRLLSTRLAAPGAHPTVVVSRFTSTVEYVATSLANRGLSTRPLTSQMAAKDITQVVENVSSPGVTVMTLASLRGLEVPAVGMWIFYEACDEKARYVVISRSHTPAPNHRIEIFELAG
jgi:superfamily II DNA or RNA helicase